jgi:hypothetical protein
MKTLLRSAAAGAVFVLSGCISVDFVQTGPTFPALAEGCPVQIYSTRTPEQYEEIGIAEIAAGTMSMQYEAVKKKACEVGANGIIPAGEKTQYSTTPTTQYHTATTNTGASMNYSTTNTQVNSYVVRKFILIRTP